MKKSQILHRFTSQELFPILRELYEFKIKWGPHYLIQKPDFAPLSHGKSIYIYSLHLRDNSTIVDNRKSFQNTIDLISKHTGNSPERLGRTYWHQLKPGQHIDAHRDFDFNGTSYFNNVNRFQLFTDLDSGFVAIMDSTIWNHTTEKSLRNSLVSFNAEDWHYYANHSNRTCYLLVADFFKDL